jgi:flagellar protein FlaG
MELQNITSTGSTYQTGMKTASQAQQTTEVKSSSATEVQKQTDELSEKQKQQDLRGELVKLTEDLNKEMNPLNINVKFGFEDKIGEMFVSVFEKDTNKLIRKFPSDEAVALMSKMREIIGIIFDKKA